MRQACWGPIDTSSGFSCRSQAGPAVLSLDCSESLRVLETVTFKEEPAWVRLRPNGRVGSAAAQCWGGKFVAGSLRSRILNLRIWAGSGWGCRGFHGQAVQNKKARLQLQAAAATRGGRSENPATSVMARAGCGISCLLVLAITVFPL